MSQVKSILDVRELHAKKDVESIIKVLEEPTNSVDIKYQAIAALGSLRDEKAVPALIKAKENQNLDFQGRVIWALGETNSIDAFKYLKDLRTEFK